MRRSPLLLTCLAALAFAADGGVKPDAGSVKPDAGVAKQPKPVFVVFEDQAAAEKYVVLKTPAERANAKGVLKKVTIGKRATGAIMLENYELPFSRRVDLTVDVVIIDPTGRVVLDKASAASASKDWDPKNMPLVPFGPALGLMYGLTDPEGEYTLKLKVWDQVRGESTSLDTKFTVSR